MNESLKTLLLVEDEPVIAMVEALALERQGYRVVQTATGKDAIAAVRRADPPIELILMDIDLGAGMDGTETARLILAEYDIPVVFLSSHIEKEIVEKTERITSYGYVVKNSGITVLDASIKMAFRLHRAHRALKAKERALAESEARYHTSIDAMIDCVHVVDRDLRISLVNDAMKEWLRQLGVSPEIEGKTIPEAFPFLNESVLREYDFVLGHGEFMITEEVTALGGREIVTETRKIPIFEDGAVVRVMTLIRDITGQTRARQTIIQSEGKYRGLYEGLMDGFVDVDLDGRIREFNEVFRQMLGYSAEELRTLRYEDITPPQWHAVERAIVEEQVMVRGYSDNYEKEYRRKDGSVFPIELRAYLTRDESGRATGMWAIVRDITEPKSIVDALRASEERFRTLVSSIDDIVYTLDREGRHTGVYGRWLERDGLAPSYFLGKTAFDLMGPELAAPHVAANGRALAGEHVVYDWSIPSPEGERHYQTMLSPLIDAQGMVYGLVGIGRETTAMRRFEERLEQSVKEKDVLLRELQHRVKNNLNVIHSLLSLDLDKMSDDRSRQVIIDAQSRIRSMSSIYDRLLRSGGLDTVDLQQYLVELAGWLYETYAIDRDRVLLAADVAPVTLDIRRAVPLGLIVNELITNALKYAFPQGRAGTVRVTLGEADGRIELRVTDDGVGLPPGFDAAAAESMGLMIVGMLTRQIDGTVTFESGGGTRALVAFPR